MKKLKIAIVGTGHVAVKSYLPYLLQRNDVELLYYNRTFCKAEDCARQFGGTAFQTPGPLMSGIRTPCWYSRMRHSASKRRLP